ncbi:MAG: DNA ligase D [Burkholderiales bacterium]
MGLTRYHAKRDFKVTGEPRGRVGASKARALAYLIQKHAASHLHYDFRLELNGVLLSWAVPKGPSFDPADKRLAMHVEDHPLEYGHFEGSIPKGQYGGGTVMLWDRGTWTPVGDPQEGYKKGHLKFDLHGEKLAGRWALVKTHGSKYGGKAEAWLLIKDNDEFAKRGIDARVVDAAPDSVVSGRSIDEIAAAKERQWHSNRSVRANVAAGAIPARLPAHRKSRSTAVAQPGDAKDAEGARRAALPAKLAPMLATLVKTAPTGDDWIHELKYDGYRMLSRLDRGRVRIISRNGKDWTGKFPALAAAVKALTARTAWLDGEVCAVDAQGRTDFQALQNALSGLSSEEGNTALVYFVFDLLHLDGHDLTGVTLVERKRLLQELIGDGSAAIRFSPEVRGAGKEVFSQACAKGLEGIVSKQAQSTYGAGQRARSWVKVKCSKRQEMVIGGFTDPQGSRAGFGALLLGVYAGGELRYAGKVGTGFDDGTLEKMRRQLNKLEQKTAPFANPPRGFEAKGAHWVAPKLVAEIEFTEWSTAGALRHPSFIGLREDKQAADVKREKPVDVSGEPAAPRKKTAGSMQKSAPQKSEPDGAAGASKDTVAGVRLSHPDKLMFPEAKLTKLDLARYYEAVADWILPQVRKRPLSLLRCPDGWGKTCFYQKHADKSVHASVTRVPVPEGGGKATYFSADSLPALVALAQWGVVELHPWGSTMPHPGRPDRLIFDFDPADDVSWQALVKAAGELKTLLEQLGLGAFLKTTGGKGLHVVVPIAPTLTWTQAKNFTKAIAELFARTFPDRYVATVSKAKRKGKIFIDYLRNAEGSTAISAYGIRARKNAPVSTPIEWGELKKKDLRFDFFNVRTVPARLRKLRADPWQDFEAARQAVSASIFKQVGVSGRAQRT